MADNRKNVLLVVRPAEGGIRQHVLLLARGLAERGWAVGIAANRQFLRELPTDLRVEQSEVVVAPRFAASDLSAATRIRRLAQGFDVVHAHGLRAAWVCALAPLRAPLIVTAHNIVPGGRLTRAAISCIDRRAARWAGVSGAIRNGLVECGIPLERIDLIPNGIDLSRYEALPERHTARLALGVEPAAVCVGYVGRLSPEKGVDVLLRVASRLPKTIFLVAGDGPSREALSAGAPANVRFLGRIEDPRLIYAAADVVAIPSRSEGQGIVAVEALAAGAPVVASRVGGLAEMLADGRTALLVPSDDADALAAAITRIDADIPLRQDLIRSGRRAAAGYDVGVMVDRTIGAYERATVSALTNG